MSIFFIQTIHLSHRLDTINRIIISYKQQPWALRTNFLHKFVTSKLPFIQNRFCFSDVRMNEIHSGNRMTGWC